MTGLQWSIFENDVTMWGGYVKVISSRRELEI